MKERHYTIILALFLPQLLQLQFYLWPNIAVYLQKFGNFFVYLNETIIPKQVSHNIG